MSDSIRKLTRWYETQCDGNWEHNYGINIDTLENPGWSIGIDLRGTKLADRKMDAVKIDRSERDWLRCWVMDGKFEGFGGPRNLPELLEQFFAWAGVTEEH